MCPPFPCGKTDGYHTSITLFLGAYNQAQTLIYFCSDGSLRPETENICRYGLSDGLCNWIYGFWRFIIPLERLAWLMCKYNSNSLSHHSRFWGKFLLWLQAVLFGLN